MQKLKHESHLKTPISTNWSIGPGLINRLVNGLTFKFLCIFSFCDPPPTFFSWNPQFFMPNAKGILIFGQNLTNI